MTYFVTITRNRANVPSDVDLAAAMVASGGQPLEVTSSPKGSTVAYNGNVNHNVYQNNLQQLAHGTALSWNFDWADIHQQLSGPEAEEATTYQVQLTMSEETVTALSSGGYNLYGFKAVQSSNKSGAPVVWFELPSTGYSTSNDISWEVQYQAYTSTTTIEAGVTIEASFTADIDLGQQLNVEGNGLGTVVGGQYPESISILSQVDQEFTCGISQTSPTGGAQSIMCAFPLYSDMIDIITPIEKVLLMFSSEPIDTGSVIEQSNSAALLIDLTGAPDQSRSVTYDLTNSWQWGNFSWGTELPADTHLVPVLIESPANTELNQPQPAALAAGH